MTKYHSKNARVYMDGYDLSAYTVTIGPCGIEFDNTDQVCLSDAVTATKAVGHPSVPPVTLNGILDTEATVGLHTVASVPGSSVILTTVVGSANPAVAGDPTHTYTPWQLSYNPGVEMTGAVLATVGFSAVDAAQLGNYGQVFGHLLHPNTAVTAVNSGTSGHDYGSQTTAGGFGFLHILGGDGTCTFTIEHSATDTDAALDSTGAIETFDTTDATTRAAEIKELSITTTVERYLRWQITLGTATTVTFVMGFVRGK